MRPACSTLRPIRSSIPGPLIVKTPIDQLSILPIGRERERSPVLFSSQEMIRLIQNLGRRYADRLLVLDAPPCLSTSDPAVLAPVVGQILFVVEAERTQRGEIEASLDLLQACPTIALVLNKQQISSRYTFGAYLFVLLVLTRSPCDRSISRAGGASRSCRAVCGLAALACAASQVGSAMAFPLTDPTNP